MRDINKLLKKEQALQSKINALFEEVIEEIYNTILTTEMVGVQQQTSDFSCATVSFTALSTSSILSAEYYIPKAQADLIKIVLNKSKSLTRLKNDIANIVEKKTVKINSYTYPINDTTIKILKNYL